MEVRHDILWGWLWTFGMAMAAMAIVAAQYAIVGPEFLAEYEITFETLVLAYTISALVAGIILGVLRPLSGKTSGGVLLGFFLTAAAYLPAAIIMGKAEGISLTTIVLSVLALSLVGGIPAGIYFSKHGFGR